MHWRSAQAMIGFPAVIPSNYLISNLILLDFGGVENDDDDY